MEIEKEAFFFYFVKIFGHPTANNSFFFRLFTISFKQMLKHLGNNKICKHEFVFLVDFFWLFSIKTKKHSIVHLS
jgi:hypothetical protein